MASQGRTGASPASSLERSEKIPRIDLCLWDHWRILLIQASITTISSGVLPLVGYIALHYATNMKTQTIISIFCSIFGVTSLFSLCMRTWFLFRSSSTCRPLGSKSRWVLDFFDWNFLGGFIVLSIIISIGISLTPSNLRIVAMSLSLLLVQVCVQLVAFVPLRIMRARTPFRISSLAKGEQFRPACYTIAEDIVAVDGKQGDVFRAIWNARYEASPPFRHLLAQLDILWGFSGLAIAAGCLATIWAVDNITIGWAVGWSVPFVWAFTMGVVTVYMTKAMCRQENEMEGGR